MQPDVITFSILIKANCDVGRHFTLQFVADNVVPHRAEVSDLHLIAIANELYHEGLSQA